MFGTASTAKYLGRDPFTEPECEECPYIPVCYGGCVYEYEKHKTHACNSVRFMYKKHRVVSETHPKNEKTLAAKL